jgi:hypothetical protein
MKARNLIPVAILAALAFAGTAAASGTHLCGRAHSGPGTGWPIRAAASVSCPFAGNVHDAYANSGMLQFWRGWVRSPVTHKRYRVTCRGPRYGPGYIHGTVTCTGANGIWLRFGPLFN